MTNGQTFQSSEISTPNALNSLSLAMDASGPVSLDFDSPTLEGKKKGKEPFSRVQPFDFRNRQAILPGDIRRLREQHEILFEKLSERFTNYFKENCTILLQDIQVVPGSSICREFPGPVQKILFGMQPLRGLGLLEIQHPLGSMLLELAGGNRVETRTMGGEFSDLEKALFEEISRLILDEWACAWSYAMPLEVQILALDNEGQTIEIAAKSAQTLCFTACFATQVFTGTFVISVPLSSMIPVLREQRLSSAASGEVAHPEIKNQAGVVKLEARDLLQDLPVKVSAQWPGLELSAREMLNLKIGEVLKLAPGCAASVEVQLGETTRFHGRPGTLGGSWAIELTDRLNP